MHQWTGCNIFGQAHAASSKCLLGVHLWVWDWCIKAAKHKKQTANRTEPWNNPEIPVAKLDYLRIIDRFLCVFCCILTMKIGILFGLTPRPRAPAQQPKQPGLLHAGANLLRFPGPL